MAAMLLSHEIGSETTLGCLDASKHSLLTMFTLANGFISGKQGPHVAGRAVWTKQSASVVEIQESG